MDITAKISLVSTSPPSDPPRGVLVSRLHPQRQAHQEIIVSLRRVNIEIHRLAGTVLALRLLHLQPELLVLSRAIAVIHFHSAGVNDG